MNIAIPAIPAGIVILLNFFAPYAVAIVVNPVWPAKYKKVIAIAVALLLAAVVLALAYFGFGIVLPAWPVLFLIAVMVSQTSYDLVTKKTADQLAITAGTGSNPS